MRTHSCLHENVLQTEGMTGESQQKGIPVWDERTEALKRDLGMTVDAL